MTFALLMLLFLAYADAQPSSTAGIKLTTRHTSNGAFASEQTQYIQADRRRMEFRNATGGPPKADGTMDINYGPHLAAIERCDLAQAFELNLDDRQYNVGIYPPRQLTKEERQARGLATELHYLSEKPTIRVEITTVDTNERKEFFGHTARHVITTNKQIPLEGSQAQLSETVTDGWYIDLETRISCDPWRRPDGHSYAFLAVGGQPIERRTFAIKGKREAGFPIELKTTTRSITVLPDGTKKEFTSTSEMLVTDLEEKPLDPTLFAVPPRFRKVDAIRRGPHQSLSAWAAFKQWFKNWLP
jgi:hypothetical protein